MLVKRLSLLYSQIWDVYVDQLFYVIMGARRRWELFYVDMTRRVVQGHGVLLHAWQIRVRAPGTGQ